MQSSVPNQIAGACGISRHKKHYAQAQGEELWAEDRLAVSPVRPSDRFSCTCRDLESQRALAEFEIGQLPYAYAP